MDSFRLCYICIIRIIISIILERINKIHWWKKIYYLSFGDHLPRWNSCNA